MIVNAVLDFEADVASIVLAEGNSARTERVGASLIADYTGDGRLLWIEVLSLTALAREDVQDGIRALIERRTGQNDGHGTGPQR